MDYIKLIIPTEMPDLVTAFIQHLPFDAFENDETHLSAYMPAKDFTESVKKELAAVQITYPFDYQTVEIPYKNWNAVWESNFTPIRVGDFCGIRADHHPDFEPAVTHEIRIQPKMAFGTGHHATTWMMMDAMKDIDFSGKDILDYGCGTSILAILASQLGAANIDAVDIEKPAVENSLEHLSLNKIENVRVFEGGLETVPGKTYHIILANINRNVILSSLSALYEQIHPDGLLLISGFIEEDANLMREATHNQGFTFLKEKQKGQWMCQVLKK